MKKLFKIKQWGGLGDALLATPSYKAIKDKFPDSRIVVSTFKPYDQLLENNPYIDEIELLVDGKVNRTIIRNYSSSLIKNFLNEFQVFSFASRIGWQIQFVDVDYSALCPKFYSKPASEIIAEMIGLQLKDNKPELFLTEREDEWARVFLSSFSTPVGINPTSRSSKNQEWPLENWERVISELSEINFIQLGSTDEPHIRGTTDLRGKTSIREAIALVKNFVGYVGVDSFLGHVAGALSTPAVILFGPSHPQVWGHRQSINLYFKTHCSPCIDDIQDLPCPYSKECMMKITIEEVKDALLKQVFRTSMPMEYLTNASIKLDEKQ